jgi:hypothetical protein
MRRLSIHQSVMPKQRFHPMVTLWCLNHQSNYPSRLSRLYPKLVLSGKATGRTRSKATNPGSLRLTA